MAICPQITLVAYELIPNSKVFVKVPDERGRWMLTDVCVVKVPCEKCGSCVGEPCKSNGGTEDGYSTGTHYVRRQAAKGRRVEDDKARRPRVSPKDLQTIEAP